MERLCLMLGSALVLAAVCLYVYDRLEDARAGAQAASAVSQLRQSRSIAAVSEAERPADSAESLPTEDAESEPEPASETPASSIEREYLVQMARSQGLYTIVDARCADPAVWLGGEVNADAVTISPYYGTAAASSGKTGASAGN